VVCLRAAPGVTRSYAWRSNNEFSRRTRRPVFYFYFFAYLPVVTSNQENNRPRVVIRSIVVYTSHGIPMMNRPIYSYNQTAGLSKKRFFLLLFFLLKFRRTLIIIFCSYSRFAIRKSNLTLGRTPLFLLKPAYLFCFSSYCVGTRIFRPTGLYSYWKVKCIFYYYIMLLSIIVDVLWPYVKYVFSPVHPSFQNSVIGALS